jgi:hypothetical protein
MLLTRYHLGDQIKTNEMGGECSTYVEVNTGFWWADLNEGCHLKDPGVDGRVRLKWSFNK